MSYFCFAKVEHYFETCKKIQKKIEINHKFSFSLTITFTFDILRSSISNISNW